MRACVTILSGLYLTILSATLSPGCMPVVAFKPETVFPQLRHHPKGPRGLRVYSDVDSATIVEHLPPGTTVVLLGYSKDRIWAKVKTPTGRIGWVAAHQLPRPRPAPPPRAR